jgi:hypothetical protein
MWHRKDVLMNGTDRQLTESPSCMAIWLIPALEIRGEGWGFG